MFYSLGLILSIATLIISTLVSIYLAWRPYKQKAFLKAFYIFIGGVFVSEVFLFFPLNYPMFEPNRLTLLTTGLASVHTAIRMFIVDCDFEFILEQTKVLSTAMRDIYIVIASFLYVLSPILTAGAALSFFANVTAHNKYLWGFFRDTYIFSELNERSLALAKSLKKGDRRRMIVFTDVFDKGDEDTFEFTERAKELDAILFKSDITIINFRMHSKKRKLYFFIVGSKENENINQTVALTSKHERRKLFSKKPKESTHGYDYDRGDTRLYLFTTNFSSEQQLSAINTKYMKVRRINDIQSLVYKLLDDNGMQIFNSAKETGKTVFNEATGENDPEKKISAIIVGLGLHGTEMLKALTWFCQMHPYRLEIDAFDMNPDADSVFQSSYPELFDHNPIIPMSPAEEQTNYHNGDNETPGEAHYTIRIHSKTNINLHSFDQDIKKLTDTTYVFVALGNDDANIKAATKIRILLRRLGCLPTIHTIVYNPNNQDMLNHSKGSYDIVPFGDTSTNYSEQCVLNSELERKALARHMAYTYKMIEQDGLVGEDREKAIRDGEESFWKSDYNYRSSVASAIHAKFKKECKIPGSEKKPEERTENEKWFFRKMEHQRWNAYVRSEGYVYAPKRDKLAKTHHLLVPFDQLPYEEQIKDDD